MEQSQNSICRGCQRQIGQENAISFNSTFWHLECFKCAKCGKLLEHDSRVLALSDDQPVCDSCTFTCHGCGNFIEDEAVLTGDLAFHEQCFKCFKCGNLLSNLVYARNENGISCTDCAPATNLNIQPTPSSLLSTNTATTFQTELEETRAKLKHAEEVLSKMKMASKSALDEFKRIKEDLAKESSIREKAEKAVWMLKAELDKKILSENTLTDEKNLLYTRLESMQQKLTKSEEHDIDQENLTTNIKSLQSEISVLHTRKVALEQMNKELDLQQEQLLYQVQTSAFNQQQQESVHKQNQDQMDNVKISFEMDLVALSDEKHNLQLEIERSIARKHELESEIEILSKQKLEVQTEYSILQESVGKMKIELSLLDKQKSMDSIGNTVRKKASGIGASLSNIFTNSDNISKGNKSNLSSTPTSPIASEMIVPASPTSTKNSGFKFGLLDSTEFKWISERKQKMNASKRVKYHSFQPQSFLVPTKCAFCSEKIWGMKAKELQCKDCGIACHSKCSSNMTLAECSILNNEKDEVALPLFGNDLFDQCEMEERSVPIFVQKFVENLESRGLEFEGIYRKSGLQSQIKILIEQLNNSKSFGADVDIDSNKYPDINVLSGILKQYFRCLPSPLTTFELYAQLVQGAMEQDPDTKLKILVKAIATLPIPNYETLKYLMLHLNKVASLEPQNKMTARNLAVVFGPNLIRSPQSAEIEASGAPGDADLELSDMAYKNAVIESLVSRAIEVFQNADILRHGAVPPIFSQSEVDLSKTREMISRPRLKSNNTLKPLRTRGDSSKNEYDIALKPKIRTKAQEDEPPITSMMNPNSYALVSGDDVQPSAIPRTPVRKESVEVSTGEFDDDNDETMIDKRLSFIEQFKMEKERGSLNSLKNLTQSQQLK